jgi:hypothetical protein
MSLPQLIGLDCVKCRKGIASVFDGVFCKCGNPVHQKCMSSGEVEEAEDRCDFCGGDPDSVLAKEVSRERTAEAQMQARYQTATRPSGEPATQTSAMPAPYPVSEVCPNCRSNQYTRQRPEKWVTFAWDRVCNECGTRYTPPTPMWAAILFLVVGFLLAGFGVVEVIGSAAVSNPCTAPAVLFGAFLGAIGIFRHHPGRPQPGEAGESLKARSSFSARSMVAMVRSRRGH